MLVKLINDKGLSAGARSLFPLAGFPQWSGERRGLAELAVGGEVIREFPAGRPRRAMSIRFLVFSVAITCLPAEPLEPERVATIIEALTRLGPEKVDANPKLKEALERCSRPKGTPQFVELVRDFHVKDQDPALLKMAVGNSNNSTGVEAVRMILAGRNLTLLASSLAGTNAVGLVEVLGATGDKQIVPLLEPIVVDSTRNVALRKRAVRALAQVQEGAAWLLKLAKEQALPEDLKLAAGSELSQVRWANIRTEAAQVLPLPQGVKAQPLPAISELVKMSGDARRRGGFPARHVAASNVIRSTAKGSTSAPAFEIGTKPQGRAL
jgi:hypothetical protein